MATITLTASIFSLALTLGVLWANPTRFSNQVYAFVTLVQTAWLGCVYRAMQAGAGSGVNKAAELEWWFRANAAVISFLPASIWLLKEAIIAQVGGKQRAVLGSLPYFGLSVFCIYLSFAPSFISGDASGFLQRGTAYYIYILIEMGVYVAGVIQIWLQVSAQTGIRKVELQFLGLNAGGAALLLVGLNALGNYLNVRAFNRSSILFVFAAWALTAWALLFHKVVNARDVLLQFARRGTFVVGLSAGIYVVWKLVHTLMAEPFGLLFSIGLCSSLVVWLDRTSRDWFDGSGQQKIAQIRRAVIECARTEFNAEKLIEEFETLLRHQYRVRSATLLFEQRESHKAACLKFDKDRPGYAGLLELGWATPESLLRRRSTEALEDIQAFLNQHSLGVVLTVPLSSPSPTMMIALGPKVDDWPFTYLDVERLHAIGQLMDNAVMRAKLIGAATLKSRMEHSAMLSRGLAHDIKNLITPISSFLVYIERHLSPGSVAAEVHGAAAQSIEAMNGYVRETLSFSERLEPRFEIIDVLKLCQSAPDVLAARATERKVRMTVQCEPQTALCGDRVLLERVLANLVSNAIDVSGPGQTVSISASHGQTGWLRLEVSDSGSGIAPENLTRIFDPYFTTKGFGQDVRGFGLGLTICQKIVLLHSGRIFAKSQLGHGTTITVDLPVDQNPTVAARRGGVNGPDVPREFDEI